MFLFVLGSRKPTYIYLIKFLIKLRKLIIFCFKFPLNSFRFPYTKKN